MGAACPLLTCEPLIKMVNLVNLLGAGHVVEMPVKQGFERHGDQELLNFFARIRTAALVGRGCGVEKQSGWSSEKRGTGTVDAMLIVRRLAKRSFEDVRSQAGAWERVERVEMLRYFFNFLSK